MPKFLSRDEIYRILQRELPLGVYPDGEPDKFYSTADQYSIANMAASAYSTLDRVYQNYFPQTADEYIDKWIDALFIGKSFDTGVTLQEKRDAVIAKLRKQPTITRWEILSILVNYVPPGTYVQVAEYNCGSAGSWTLDESELDVSTNLGFNFGFDTLGIDMSDWCATISNRGWELDVDELDNTTELDLYGYEEIVFPQLDAYGYEVRIFNYAVTGTQFEQMKKQVLETDPARSVAMFFQNLDLNDYGLVNDVGAVSQFSLVDCITRDSSLSTGFRGRTTL